MKRTLTFIASVGIFAAVSANDQEKFLPSHQPELVQKQVSEEKEITFDKQAEMDINKAQQSSFNASTEKENNLEFGASSHFNKDFEKEFEASSKQVARGEHQRSMADARKAEFEGIKAFNNEIREGQMAYVNTIGNEKNHKNLEEHHEYLEETEHINSEKDKDCEKVNHQKWMKKKHQKKAINHHNKGDRKATIVKKRGKGFRKSGNEERKNRKHQNKNGNEANSFVRVNKNRIHTELEVEEGKAKAMSGDRHYSSDKEKSGTNAHATSFKAEKEAHADLTVNKDAQAIITRKD